MMNKQQKNIKIYSISITNKTIVLRGFINIVKQCIYGLLITKNYSSFHLTQCFQLARYEVYVNHLTLKHFEQLLQRALFLSLSAALCCTDISLHKWIGQLVTGCGWSLFL